MARGHLFLRHSQALVIGHRRRQFSVALGCSQSSLLLGFQLILPFSSERTYTMRQTHSVARLKRERHYSREPSLSKTEALTSPSSLKRFLVTSAPYCCYWFAAAFHFRAEALSPRSIGCRRSTDVSSLGDGLFVSRLTRCHGGWGTNTGLRLFSNARDTSTDGAEDFSTIIANDDSDENNENATFATTYHAPVMVNECLEALLECQRGRIRNQDPESFNPAKKGKKKRKKKELPDESTATSNNEQPTPESGETNASYFPPLIFVDGTLGGGGHSNALLQRLKPGDILFGCDVDPNALRTASDRLAGYMNHSGEDRPLFVPVRSNFGDLADTLPDVVHPVTREPILGKANVDNDVIGVDGILLDLGVSSHQIDEPERGFSFMRDGPLDMRMGSDSDSDTDTAGGLTAADICNEFDEQELQRIFSVYGDEPKAKTIAKAITRHRPLHTTGALVDAIASVTPKFAKNKRHGTTATCARVFQSLRIVVNNEDGVLSRVLSEACPKLLRPGGHLVIMSYHSMEDRATKRIMRDGTLDKNGPKRNQEKDMYGNYVGPPKPFRPIRKRQKATEEEIARNPRARSAVLRVAERLDSNGLSAEQP